MIDGKTNTGTGPTPPYDGLYAVEVYHGWKLMEWHKGAWWHMGRVGKWDACVPHQWVGPLPARKYQTAPPAQEFDL